MSVVGIDFGSLNTVVAVARNRGIDVITNEVSNRTTPSLVSFGEKQRYLGEAAKTQEISNFRNTVSSLKRLIGRPFEDPDVAQVERRFVNCSLVEGERGEVSADVSFRGDSEVFSFTQLSAMFLAKVRDFTQAEIKIPVTDCVISVPSWFTDQQRRAMIDAANVAQLNPLRVISDTTAIALGYGITKTDLPESPKSRNVVFVDFGYSSFQVAVVSFTKGKLVVKGTAFDRNLGGRDFDDVLVKHFSQEFLAKYKLDVPSNKKATYRLRLGVEKVKKILSANSEAVLNIECLMEDRDVSSHITRGEFEKLVTPLISRMTKPLEEALSLSGLTVQDIDAVELIGGTTRVPKVKEVLSDFFGGKLSTTLNQDEAVARGCALQCAILSPVFKVRDFTVQDWNKYPVSLTWDPSLIHPPKEGGIVDSKMDAFPLGNQIPSTKMLTLLRKLDGGETPVDLVINAAYSPEIFSMGAPQGHGTDVGSWTISGIKKQKGLAGDVLADETPRAVLKVKVRLDGNQVVGIESAQQIEDYIITVDKPAAPAPVEKSKEENAAEGESKMDEDKKDEKEESNEAKAPAAKETKKVTRKFDLVVSASTAAVPAELLSKWQALEGEMAAADRLVIDTAEKRNALEEYVYETRSKLEMAWSEFVTDEIRSSFMKQLNQMKDWLYTEEGEEATKSVFVAKLDELKKIGDPIAFRVKEHESRHAVEKELRDYINGILLIDAGDERYSHIPKEEIQKCHSEARKKLDWLNDKIARQLDLPKTADCVITCHEIVKSKDALMYYVNPILNKPKPAPKKEDKPAETPESKEKDTEMDQEPPLEEVKENDKTMDVDA